MLNFLAITALGLGLAGWIIPAIRAYQAAIGVPAAIEKAGSSLVARIRLRLLGAKTFILGYVALLVSALPDFMHGLANMLPEVHDFFEQMDLSIWLDAHTVIGIHNVLNIAMMLTRLAGLMVMVNGVPTAKSEGS